MIPDAAVEAAAEDLYDREGYSTSLADAPKYRRDRFLTQAREVLEAAAPHMLAESWDEGHDAGFTFGAFQGRVNESPNPYRPAP